MKVITLPRSASEDEKYKTKMEAEILNKYKHPNIVEFFESFDVLIELKFSILNSFRRI